MKNLPINLGTKACVEQKHVFMSNKNKHLPTIVMDFMSDKILTQLTS